MPVRFYLVVLCERIDCCPFMCHTNSRPIKNFCVSHWKKFKKKTAGKSDKTLGRWILRKKSKLISMCRTWSRSDGPWRLSNRRNRISDMFALRRRHTPVYRPDPRRKLNKTWPSRSRFTTGNGPDSSIRLVISVRRLTDEDTSRDDRGRRVC